MGDDVAELRARLVDRATILEDTNQLRTAALLRETGTAIDGMLARLAAAEADADRLAWVATWAGPGDELGGNGIDEWVNQREIALRLYDETLTLRDPR